MKRLVTIARPECCRSADNGDENCRENASDVKLGHVVAKLSRSNKPTASA